MFTGPVNEFLSCPHAISEHSIVDTSSRLVVCSSENGGSDSNHKTRICSVLLGVTDLALVDVSLLFDEAYLYEIWPVSRGGY